MAGDYLTIDHDLPEKPEVLGIIERTNEPIDAVLGRLFLLWRLADRQTIDGVIPHAGPRSLAQRCGGSAEFWCAVAEVGWIAFSESGAVVPDFEQRFGASAKKRIGDAQRQRRYRNRQRGRDRTVTEP